ncbi:MAG: hypothetical protein O1I36_06160 [Cylindrospermopsis raciborskii PAMP2011]|nr:hypothetical protein [Cylindrospermopsis raciborskii PAMP2011]
MNGNSYGKELSELGTKLPLAGDIRTLIESKSFTKVFKNLKNLRMINMRSRVASAL